MLSKIKNSKKKVSMINEFIEGRHSYISTICYIELTLDHIAVFYYFVMIVGNGLTENDKQEMLTNLVLMLGLRRKKVATLHWVNILYLLVQVLSQAD